jgi:2-phospho-L-lactate guanylyltransferase
VSAPVLAVIPVKPLAGALGRLGGALGPPARRALQVAMLADVLGACRAAPALAGTLVVTADPEVEVLARGAGARVVAEGEGPRGMNAAVRQGLAAAGRAGAGAALVLTADLPLVGPDDLAALVALAPERAPAAALAPSRDGTGTNAMLLRPPAALAPRLGPGSLARHLAQAARRGVAVAVCERPGLALDVDTPDDLAALCAAGAGRATGAALARAGLAGGLAVGSPR